LSYVENHPTSDYSFNFTEQECLNLKRVADYPQCSYQKYGLAQQRFGQTVALKDPHAQPEVVLTYAQLYQQIQQFAAGLQALVQPAADRVAPSC